MSSLIVFQFRNSLSKGAPRYPWSGRVAPSPMDHAEQHGPPINKRRYQRYELESELKAAILGGEQRGIMRGRALNISEAGMAGVFTTGWDVGTPVNLEFSVPITSSLVRVE